MTHALKNTTLKNTVIKIAWHRFKTRGDPSFKDVDDQGRIIF